MKPKHHRKTRMVLMVVMVLMWTAGVVAADERMPESAAKTRGMLDIDSLATEKISLTIRAKEHDKIRTKIWDFAVTDRTEFVTPKGDLISFKDLKVPCDTVIYYEPSNTIQTSRTAWRVNIRKVGKDASDTFSETEPY